MITGGQSLEILQSNGIASNAAMFPPKKLSGRCFGSRIFCMLLLEKCSRTGQAVYCFKTGLWYLFCSSLKEFYSVNLFQIVLVISVGVSCCRGALDSGGKWKQWKTSTMPLWKPSDKSFKLPVCLGCACKISKWMGGQAETYVKIPPGAFGGLCSKEQLHSTFFLVSICFRAVTSNTVNVWTKVETSARPLLGSVCCAEKNWCKKLVPIDCSIDVCWFLALSCYAGFCPLRASSPKGLNMQCYFLVNW